MNSTHKPRNRLKIGEASQELTQGCEESGRFRRRGAYVHSCHSMATGENKAGLATGRALALLLMPLALAFPSHLLLIHHRLLPMHSTLL